MAIQSQIKWGWSIPCSHPGCTEVLQVWGPEGYAETPPIPHTSEIDGWFWHTGARRYDRRHGHRYEHHALCPDHAPAGKDWRARLAEWEKARWAVGKQKATGLRALLGRVCPRLVNRETGEVVRKWEQKHPKPLPPWEQ